MNQIIQNQYLRVKVHSKGAELASIYSLEEDLELMWDANPEFWSRHSCILFPVIGCVREGTIRIDDEIHHMTKHGIVRDAQFECIENKGNQVSFILRSNKTSLDQFPFPFHLIAKYHLIESSINVSYEVFNAGQVPMPFNIGAHPAFQCPVFPHERRSDYSLRFSQKETQESPIINSDGLISDKTQKVCIDAEEIQLTDHLFDHDALILTDLNSDKVSLVRNDGKVFWTFHFPGFTHLGIWSKNRTSPFVCIEPWFGIADEVDGPREFSKKKAIQWVEPGETWTCTHTVSLPQKIN